MDHEMDAMSTFFEEYQQKLGFFYTILRFFVQLTSLVELA